METPCMADISVYSHTQLLNLASLRTSERTGYMHHF